MDHSFVAINYIDCAEEYRPRFEALFATRAHAIDRLAGFRGMEVLKPKDDSGSYLVISFWEKEEDFNAWMKSPEFLEGHRRGFQDIAQAKAEGREAPMKSTFKTYKVISE